MPVTPRDLLLVRQAIRENWDVPDGVRKAVIENIFHEALKPSVVPRLQIAAVRCVLAMTAADQRVRFAAIDAARAAAQQRPQLIVYQPALEAPCHS